MQQEHKQLKRVRDKMEEIQQDLDTMRDNITKWYMWPEVLYSQPTLQLMGYNFVYE